jgi:hypothetical protein
MTPGWMRFIAGLEQPLPDPVPVRVMRLDTGAIVDARSEVVFADVDEHLSQRVSWFPTREERRGTRRPRRFASLFSPGYGG